jgi:probable HAF family extracellular repeat protein
MKPLAYLSLAGIVIACNNPTEPVKRMMALSTLAPAPTISTTVIGNLGPGTNSCLFPQSAALDVNDRGLVVGWSDSACALRGFVWDTGVMTNLGAIAPVAVNNHDQIAANIDGPFPPLFPDAGTHGVLLQKGVLTDLGTLGGDMSWAVALNDNGQIVGYSTTADGATHAFLWQAGTMTDLGTLGGSSSRAITVNERGQVAGNSDTPSGATHGFLWQNGVITDLGTLGGPTSEVRALNARGQAVGRSVTATGATHAFLWQAGAMTDLGTLGGAWSEAHAVNRSGQIAGVSATGVGVESHVFLWQNGTLTDLGSPRPSNTLLSPLKMNDRGQIVGSLVFAVSLRAGMCFLWQAGTVTQLPTALAGETVALNKHGQIVGWDLFPFDFTKRAILWQVSQPEDEMELATR